MGGVQFGGRVSNWDDEISVNGGMGKKFCPHFHQPFLENVDRSRELFPIFHNPHRKHWVAVARTLEYLVRVPSKAAANVLTCCWISADVLIFCSLALFFIKLERSLGEGKDYEKADVNVDDKAVYFGIKKVNTPDGLKCGFFSLPINADKRPWVYRRYMFF